MRIGIVGAGIMGRLLAFSLVNEDHEIDLFDKGEANCSMAAAGLLTPIAELEKSEKIIFDLGIAALNEYWPSILKLLPEAVFFQHNGSVLLSHPQDQEELSRCLQKITLKKIIDFTVPLNNTDLIKLEPQLTRFQQGYYFANEGQLDSQAVLDALKKYLINRQINWYENTNIDAITPEGIFFKNKKYHYDLIIDCRGMGAKQDISGLRGVRGELIWLHAPEVVIHHPIRFYHPRYSLYIAPRPNQRYAVGASEIEAHDNSDISVRTVLELLTAVCYVHPGFAEARVIKTVTQSRPTLKDHLPKIKYADGLLAVNGLYRHGFLVSPTLVNDILLWIKQGMAAVKFPQLWEKYA